MKNLVMVWLMVGFFVTSAAAGPCSDELDTFDDYDKYVERENDIPSQYYVLSYTWAPDHCDRLSPSDRQPGKKDYLQCGGKNEFRYILHGLWPQGALDGRGGYPRSCEGDQGKIDRAILEDYLCMTPSVWLLQHEYEFHGTCMHDEGLETPRAYFETALGLHRQLKLPPTQLPYNEESIAWFVRHNPHLRPEAIQYYKKGREWQFCFDNQFRVMGCPSNKESVSTGQGQAPCPVKGNISKSSGKKYYFTGAHPDYLKVVIDKKAGERCFDDEKSARAAGWTKAP